MKKRVRYMWLCGFGWVVFMVSSLFDGPPHHLTIANVWLASWFIVSAMGEE